MIVSWNWLKQYVLLDMPVQELEQRLMMAGLNHESTEDVHGDMAIDLEVTSNRPDCLGHLGIAREVGVLWGRELEIPPADPPPGKTPVSDLTKVDIQCPELCYRFTARVIEGIKVGPSPAWMVNRLRTVGIESINNVVDITNYVLMECGQPLHAYDFDKLRGRRIIVRESQLEETFDAINHKTYTLPSGTCVIADAEQPVGLGGVMGGLDSEISDSTVNVLVEAAEFAPRSIRSTARALNLHSDSSYRFERGVDPAGVDWASRRCCQLILDLAGGTLAQGVIDVGRRPPEREKVTLRYSQLKRILGIEVPVEEVLRILTALGMDPAGSSDRVEVVPPSWRRDLTREIDLVEEVARIHGYEQIPEDVRVPMAPSARSHQDRVLEKVRHALTACGYHEAVTVSLVTEQWAGVFSPWSKEEPLRSTISPIGTANCLRRSLVPSLLGVRRGNEAASNPRINLFEVAKAYLPQKSGLPEEVPLVSWSGDGNYFAAKSLLEALLAELHIDVPLELEDVDEEVVGSFFAPQAAQIKLGGELLGYLGQVSDEGRKVFKLRGGCSVGELRLSLLVEHAQLIPKSQPVPTYPPVQNDLNFIVDGSLRWGDLASTVKQQAGDLMEHLEFRETYRNAELAGKKKLLFTVTLRSRTGTLTGDDVAKVREKIISACEKEHGAALDA